MLAISAAELTSIRTEANVLLTISCAVQRKSLVADGMGQATEVWSTISSPTLKVGMRTPTQQELANYDYLIGALAAWVVKLPYGTDVKHQDHLVIGSDTLVVQQDLSLHSFPIYQLVLASEVK